MKKFFIAIFLFLSPVCARAVQWAIVSVSVTDMKKSPDYRSETVSQAILGTPVQVTGSEGYWYSIVTPEGYKGWTTRMNICLADEEEYQVWKTSDRVIMTGHYCLIRSRPDNVSEVLSDCVMGSVLVAAGEENGFRKVVLPDGKTGFLPGEAVCGLREWMESKTQADGEDIVAVARLFTGFPYLWGGLSPKGFDCSGLVKLCYFMNGMVLPRDAREQMATGKELDCSDILGEFRPGDLVFFGTPASSSKPASVTHVGIYVSEGYMIHSSLVVRINCLLPGRDDSYTGKKMVGAVRVIGNAGLRGGVVPVLDHPWYF